MKYQYSDRECTVCDGDAEDVIRALRGWAFDHSYDRNDSLPHDFPNKALLEPVVFAAMTEIFADWRDKTLPWQDEFTARFESLIRPEVQRIVEGKKE